jgi:hypothetical protein
MRAFENGGRWNGRESVALHGLNGNHAQNSVLLEIGGKAVAELVEERQPRFVEIVRRVEDQSPLLEAARNILVPGPAIAEFSFDIFCRRFSDSGVNPATSKLDFEHGAVQATA